MPPRTEYTSARIAKIAGKILAAQKVEELPLLFPMKTHGYATFMYIPGNQIRALAASALNQTRDKPNQLAARKSTKPKRKRKARG